MIFPKFHIDEVKRQTDRDLNRFDIEMDLPDHFLPEFPPPMFLTTRSDLGDVSRGQLITSENFYDLRDHSQSQAARRVAAAGDAFSAAAVQCH